LCGAMIIPGELWKKVVILKKMMLAAGTVPGTF
jgi:hypothetical protein